MILNHWYMGSKYIPVQVCDCYEFTKICRSYDFQNQENIPDSISMTCETLSFRVQTVKLFIVSVTASSKGFHLASHLLYVFLFNILTRQQDKNVLLC